MTTFNWLIIGHLIGDWMFQNDWMVSGKRRGLFTTAGLTHFTLYTIIVIGLLWLVDEPGKMPLIYTQVGLIIFFSHWIIDATELVESWMDFFHQRRSNQMVRIMIDQLLHVSILAVLTRTVLVS